MSQQNYGTPPLAASAAAVSSFVLRIQPGGVDFIQVNSTTVAGWVMLHNAVAAPSNGAVTPVLTWQLPANSTMDRGFDPPLEMTVGAVLTFSTTGPTTQTLSATASFGGRLR